MLPGHMNKQKRFLGLEQSAEFTEQTHDNENITVWCTFSAHSISNLYFIQDEDSTYMTDQILSPNHHALSSWPTVLSVRNFPLQGQQRTPSDKLYSFSSNTS